MPTRRWQRDLMIAEQQAPKQTVQQAPINLSEFVESFLDQYGHRYTDALAAASGAEAAAILKAAMMDRGFGQRDRFALGIETVAQWNRRQALAAVTQ